MLVAPLSDKLTEFFPDCILPKCELRDTSHQHILPHQQDILSCSSMYLYCQGGVGSAKSLAFAVKCVYLACTIPRNVGFVARLHYDDLFTSSWKEILQCISRLVDKDLIPEPKYKKKVQGEYTQIDFWNGSELHAFQAKNLQRALGSSFGFFWVDDAMEVEEGFFVGNNTSGGVLSRLRLPHIRFNRATYNEDHRKHGSLHGMVSSNPPPYGHWLHKLFGSKPGVHSLDNDTVTWMQVETTSNPFVGEDYAKSIIAVQKKMGRPEGVIQRIIKGQSIPAYRGIPVFPQFDRAVHIAPLIFKPELPLIRSWDFGYNHPAVTFSNIFKCAYRTNHYFTLSEVGDATNVNIYQFYDNYVLPHTKVLYSNAKLLRDCGDRSGYRSSPSNKDNRSDMKILIDEYHLPFRWKYINLEPSLQYIRGLLHPKKPCPCGLPLVLISNRCPILAGALEGGYHFSQSRSGSVSVKPIEDHYFADVACAWRYGAENYVKWGIDYEDRLLPDDTRKPVHRTHFEAYESARNSWMEQFPA